MGAFDQLRSTSLAYGWTLIWFRAALLTYSGVIFVIVISGTVWLWSQGEATPGAVVAAGSVAMRLMMMAGWVSFSLMTIYTNLGEVEDGMRTLSPPHTLTDHPNASELSVTEAKVEFKDLSFAYGRETGGVNNVNLTLKPGEKLGIVGASGAGKSTLVSLLLRLHDAESGAVLIDGQNVSSVTQDSLRNAIGMVTQETSMFNRSARDNILYGRPDASEEDLREASQKAEADLFIKDIIDNKGRTGYDAHLGERGVKLSGGQRQRIALARAILKDAPILVLDEATSALDSEVEASIQAALEHVMEGKPFWPSPIAYPRLPVWTGSSCLNRVKLWKKARTSISWRKMVSMRAIGTDNQVGLSGLIRRQNSDLPPHLYCKEIILKQDCNAK